MHDADNVNYDSRQVLIAPIFNELELLNSGDSLLISHIPIKASDYGFLGEDSYISTHQIMPINRSWLRTPSTGEINDLDLIYRMDLGIIHAAGLMGVIQDIIHEEAEKQQLIYTKIPLPQIIPLLLTTQQPNKPITKLWVCC